ncbi:unnamed protein product [Blepharisma stoltei]|uniref:CCHC-type domain-containing protein n=1 Tax=Blepharisma stoltei TaxID=1481888 RepID=A0AAU9K236_9CILI|nr:unnamed protein product [Blepharisma stoltei]
MELDRSRSISPSQSSSDSHKKPTMNRLGSTPLFKKRNAPFSHDLNIPDSASKASRRPSAPGIPRSREPETQITPEIAAMVVRQYLLPMFESDNVGKGRNMFFGLPGMSDINKPLEVISGTVYGELKLADQLMNQLTQARKEMNQIGQNLKDAEQERKSVLAELENVKKQYLSVISEIETCQYQFQETLCAQQQSDLKLSFMNNQLYEYKQLYALNDAENKQFTVDLHEEKALNDKRRNTAAELEHGNQLLRMENDIMSERLGGLYQELDKLSQRRFIEDKLVEETDILVHCLRNLADYCNNLSLSLISAMNQRDELKIQHADIEALTEEIKTLRDKLVSKSKEARNSIEKEYNSVVEQREEYKSRLSKLEKAYKDMSESYEKLRQKLKQWKQRGKQYGEQEEKVCSKCRQTYTEKENYNWSCKTHSGQFNGEMYWCCGRKGKEALGCQTSKHVSKEDEDEEAAKEKEDDKFKQGTAKCSSCKEIGHRAHECPKDPNIRSALDAVDEIDRIDGIKSRKKANVNNIDVNQKLMGILNARFGQIGFGDDMASSAGTETLRGMEEEEENAENNQHEHDPFKDLHSMRNEVSFQTEQNAVKIDDIQTREETENIRSGKRRQTTGFSNSKNFSINPRTSGQPSQDMRSPSIDSDFKIPNVPGVPSQDLRSPSIDSEFKLPSELKLD